MKSCIKINLFILSASLMAILPGCSLFDMELQKQEEYTPDPREPFLFDMTAWEWLESFPADSGFSLMRDAIIRAGYQELFSREDTVFTFFLVHNIGLNDPTLKGNGQPKLNGFVKDMASKKVAQQIFDAGNKSLEGVEDIYIQWLVEYHTIPGEAIHQSDIPARGTEFLFNTMYQDPEAGVMVLERDHNLEITVNNTSLFEDKNKSDAVRWHNYRFKNGVAHLMDQYVSYHANVKKSIGG